uniref:Uncharacterized protein n=1 Tax=Parascaris univalens TaxID=6257 RepID=A0A915BZC1_PARUN
MEVIFLVRKPNNLHYLVGVARSEMSNDFFMRSALRRLGQYGLLSIMRHINVNQNPWSHTLFSDDHKRSSQAKINVFLQRTFPTFSFSYFISIPRPLFPIHLN